MFDRKRAVQAYAQDADLLAFFHQVSNCGFHSLSTGRNNDNDTLGIRCAKVIEKVVLPPGQFCKIVHCFLNDGGAGLVVGVDRLTPLEINIRVLGGTTKNRMFG